MNVRDIKDIIRLVNESELAEVEIEAEGFKLVVKRYVQVMAQPGSMAPMSHHAPQPAPPQAQSVAPLAATGLSLPGDGVDDDQIIIPSPMVGTFYRSPAPGAPAFAEVGQVVQQGQSVCIIEAMKLMNEIESEFSGRLIKVLVEDTQPVEYGQPLFILERV